MSDALIISRVEYHRDRILESYAATVGAIFETGQRLIAAKDELPHGEFERMVMRDLPFGPSSARRLMLVCKDARLNRAPGHDLPASWRTLYQLTTLSDDEWAIVEPYISPELERRDITRLLRDGSRRPPPPLPEGSYRVIYADPPWQYGQSVEGYGPADFHYPTMDTESIQDLAVAALAAPDSALFLWTTSPKLEEGLSVMRAWGFRYKASFIWDKVRHNYGHYNSVRHEFLLIGTRGSAAPAKPKLFDSVVVEDRTEHSAKPERFRAIIDTIYEPASSTPDRIELFCRGDVPEWWDSWGDEAV